MNLSDADLIKANLSGANLIQARLSRVNLSDADLTSANLTSANLTRANLFGADLSDADLTSANLTRADLIGTHLTMADLSRANLFGARLIGATLLSTQLNRANLTGCSIYGVSAWNVNLEGAIQSNLRITPENEPAIHVDNLEVAQFVYLLLNNPKIRTIIDTIGKKGVLLLGRFTEGRMAILETLQKELRNRDFVPMVFNFDKPDTKDFTETVRILAGLSRFIIADITNPRSAPLELQAVVPEYMTPFIPILEKGEEPFAMFRDIWIKYRDWVLEPIRYPSVDRLVEVLDSEIIKPAEARFNVLLARKTEEIKIKDI